jgi:hypothetical protein
LGTSKEPEHLAFCSSTAMIHIVCTIKMFELTGTSTIDVRLGQGCPEVERSTLAWNTNHRSAQPRDQVIGRLKILKERIVSTVVAKVQMQDMVPCSLTLHKGGRETSQGAANLAGLNDRRW